MTPVTGQRIPVSLGERSYEIVLEPGSSRTLGERLKHLINTAKIGIITDMWRATISSPPSSR